MRSCRVELSGSALIDLTVITSASRLDQFASVGIVGNAVWGRLWSLEFVTWNATQFPLQATTVFLIRAATLRQF